MNAENKNSKKIIPKTRLHRISIYLNDDELSELRALTEPWNLSRSQIVRRLLFGKQQVMLDTKATMEALDRIGLAIETCNSDIKNLQTLHEQRNSSSEKLHSMNEKLLIALENNRSSIKDCSRAILQLIKKI